MKVISDKKRLVSYVQNEKDLGLVPTMGAIHFGHKSLIKKSKDQNSKTIVTIFVNKPQFNNKNDFKKYPRLIKRDISILKNLKVDYLYTPSYRQIYPKGTNRKIKIDPFEKKLCGKFRPGHFKAVIDVVDRFIKLINPKKIYFGEKDMQQLKLIENFVKKKYKTVKIIPCKTIRESNGIPYSSRNFLLSPKEKKIASKIFNLIIREKKNLIYAKKSLKILRDKILSLGVNQIDYIKLLDVNRIIKPYKKKNEYKIFIAYYLGSTRLIDNI